MRAMSLDLKVRIFAVKDDLSFEQCMLVRWKGLCASVSSPEACEDVIDKAKQTTLFLAQDRELGPLGSVRVVNRQFGELELERYCDLEKYLGEHWTRCTEVTRFAVLPGPKQEEIRRLLWKAVWLYSVKYQVRYILKACPELALDRVKSLGFEPLPDEASFVHPCFQDELLRLCVNDMEGIRGRFESVNHPLYHFLFEENHTQIEV